MKLSALLAPLLDTKADHETIRKMVLAYESEQADALEKRRESDRKRQTESRDRKAALEAASRDITLRHSDSSLTCAAARGEDNLLTSNQAGQEERKKEPRKRAERMPDDYQPSIEVAMEIGLTFEEATFEAAQIRDWSKSAPDSKALKSDWPATWRGWCRRALKQRQERHQHRSGAPPPKGVVGAALRIIEGSSNGTANVFGTHSDAQQLPPKRLYGS